MERRNSRRLPNYDYSADGAYFVTMVLEPRFDALGRIIAGRIELTEEGQIVAGVLQSLERVDRRIRLDEWCVMPDHVHAILFIVSHQPPDLRPAIHELQDVRKRRVARRRMLLSRIIGRFKQNSAKRINLLRNTPGHTVWNRNYYERVIRNNEELERIRLYIRSNPRNWGNR